MPRSGNSAVGAAHRPRYRRTRHRRFRALGRPALAGHRPVSGPAHSCPGDRRALRHDRLSDGRWKDQRRALAAKLGVGRRIGPEAEGQAADAAQCVGRALAHRQGNHRQCTANVDRAGWRAMDRNRAAARAVRLAGCRIWTRCRAGEGPSNRTLAGRMPEERVPEERESEEREPEGRAEHRTERPGTGRGTQAGDQLVAAAAGPVAGREVAGNVGVAVFAPVVLSSGRTAVELADKQSAPERMHQLGCVLGSPTAGWMAGLVAAGSSQPGDRCRVVVAPEATLLVGSHLVDKATVRYQGAGSGAIGADTADRRRRALATSSAGLEASGDVAVSRTDCSGPDGPGYPVAASRMPDDRAAGAPRFGDFVPDAVGRDACPHRRERPAEACQQARLIATSASPNLSRRPARTTPSSVGPAFDIRITGPLETSPQVDLSAAAMP